MLRGGLVRDGCLWGSGNGGDVVEGGRLRALHLPYRITPACGRFLDTGEIQRTASQPPQRHNHDPTLTGTHHGLGPSGAPRCKLRGATVGGNNLAPLESDGTRWVQKGLRHNEA